MDCPTLRSKFHFWRIILTWSPDGSGDDLGCCNLIVVIAVSSNIISTGIKHRITETEEPQMSRSWRIFLLRLYYTDPYKDIYHEKLLQYWNLGVSELFHPILLETSKLFSKDFSDSFVLWAWERRKLFSHLRLYHCYSSHNSNWSSL